MILHEWVLTGRVWVGETRAQQKQHSVKNGCRIYRTDDYARDVDLTVAFPSLGVLKEIQP